MRDEDLRALLVAEAESAPRPEGLRARTIRKARLRKAALLSTSIAAVLAVGVSATVALSSLDEGPRDVVSPQTETSPGRIAFARWTDDGGGIYVMDGDGAGARMIADGGHHAIDAAAWSPDGSKIAFHGFYGEAANEAGGLFVVNADGSGRYLVDFGAGGPTWSPDGDEVMYTRGGNVYRTAVPPDRRGPEVVPIEQDVDFVDWSPSGDRLVFSLDGIYVVPIGGGRPTKIVDGQAGRYPTHPQWSPDGSTIAFTSPAEDPRDNTIDIVKADGTRRQTVTRGSNPAWSPDGRNLAFERMEDPNSSHIYSVGIDGNRLEQLTFGKVADHSPDWVGAPEPDCGTVDVASDDYGVQLGATRGAVGDRVPVSGTTFRGEDGRWVAADRIEMWWNTETPNGRPIDDGPVVELLEHTDMNACTWEGSFEVPDAPSGDYTITTLVFDDSGYGVFGTDEFAVEEAGGGEQSSYAWPAPFVPSTASQGDFAVLKALFMNRTLARLAYPAELGLAEMGVQTTISYRFDDGRAQTGASFDVVAVHGEVPDGLLGEELERFDVAPSGQATLHQVTGEGALRGLRGDPPYALLFTQSGWNLVATLPSREDAATVAENLHPSVTDEGWPSVSAAGPLELSRGFGEARGPHLEFNDEDPRWDVHTRDTYVLMGVVSGCGRAEDGISGSGENSYAAKCLAFEGADLGIFVSMYGPEEFVRDLYEGLRLE